MICYDSSKNQVRVWHNTSVCGNLINLRASLELADANSFVATPPAGFPASVVAAATLEGFLGA